MSDMNELTAAQQLKPVKQALGKPFQLLPYQSVKKVTITADSITVLLQVYQFTETYREVRFHKSGLMMYAWKLKDNVWIAQHLGGDDQIPLVIWDESFEPYIECRFGTHRSIKEYYDRLEWESNVHRPGTSRTPLDNFTRTVEAAQCETTPAMFKYWTGVDRELLRGEKE
jgi:hypothetical protein